MCKWETDIQTESFRTHHGAGAGRNAVKRPVHSGLAERLERRSDSDDNAT